MHIRLLAGSLFPTAGSHIYNGELIRRLAARGHRVSVACFDDGGQSWPAEVLPLPRYDFSAVPAAWRFATPLQATLSRLQVATAGLDEPDAVIAAEHLFLKPHARRFPRVPWLYLPHSLVVAHEIDSYAVSGIHGRLMRRFYVRQQKWALRRASGVVRFSRWAADALVRCYGGSIQCPFLINPPGVEIPEDAEPRKASSGPLRLLFVGRLVPSKNLALVIESLAAHRDADWTLDVVGEGPQRKDLEARAGRAGLAGRIRFRGHQAGLDAWYRAADLLVFPSKLESLGLVVLEAMAQGVPALVVGEDGDRYRVPFSELIEDGVSGLVARDEADFRERLARVLGAPGSLARLAPAAQEAVRSTYDWSRHLDRYEEAFERLRSVGPVRSAR